MANRRISELQEIAGIDLADADLFTVVRTGEVDPSIKNKKLTVSGTKAYLNIYYLPRTGGTVSGSVLIEDNLTVLDQTTTSGLAVSNTATVGTLFTSGNATVSGTFSGVTITGTTVNATSINAINFTTSGFSTTSITGVSGIFTTLVSGLTVTGVTGVFGNLIIQSGTVNNRLNAGTLSGDFGLFSTVTGVTGIYTNSLSGTTVTGTTANFTTGNFQVLNAGSHSITGNLTVTGNLRILGSGYFSSGVNISGTLSGTTVTGSNAQFTNITGVNLIGTTQVSGATVTGGLGQFTTLTGGTAGFTTVTGTTVTGTTGSFTTLNAITAFFTTGIVRENITVTGDATVESDLFVRGSGFFSSGINVTGRVSGVTITGAGGGFTTLTGTTVTGTTANFVSGVFSTQVSGLNITGQFGRFNSVESTVITGGNIIGTTSISGTSVSGINAQFGTLTGNTAGFTTLTGITITGTTANFVSGVYTTQLSGATVTGGIARFTSGIFNTIVAASHTVTGNLVVSGDLNVEGTVSGSTFAAGNAIFVSGSGDLRPYGLFSFPATVGTSGYFLKTEADGTTTWAAGAGGYAGGDFVVYNGDLIVSGDAYFSSGVTITGNVQASTVTGDTGLFTQITGNTLHVTAPSGATAALVCSGVVSGDANGFVIQGPLIILP